MAALTKLASLRVSAAAIAALVVTAALGWLFIAKTAPLDHLKVGVDHSPPFYIIHADGSVEGLAVDVLNEAARRRKIHLEWVPLHDIPLDSALERRIVQLWPLVGSTTDRRSRFYMSEPWLESEYILVSLRSQPIRTADDAAGKLISHARLRFTKAIMDRYLSRSQELVRLYRAEAIQSVCRREAAAALVESRVLDAILLSRPEGCETAQFQISSLPGASSPLAIAAVPEVRATAAALRDEIRKLAQDGFLSSKLDQWSPVSAEGMRSVWAEEEAVRRGNIYRASLMVILLLASGLGWLAWRARHLRLKAESADAGKREAQRRFSAFMETSPAVAFMKDSRGKMLYVNRALSQLIGKTQEQCIGLDDYELWPGNVAEDLRNADLRMLSEDRPIQRIEQIPVSPHDVRHMLVVKFPFASECGEKFIGGTAIDITEREVAIRALAASEIRYRELFEQNPVPAWVCDRDTLAFLNVNVAAIRRYGWTREDFLSGMRLPDVLSSDGDGKHHVTKDGLRLTVDATSYELEYEGRHGCLMIVRDLTELESTLDQLRLSEERWKLALHGAGDGLWDWDLTTNHVFRSPRWLGMLGYEEWEIGDSHSDFIALLHPDDLTATLRALADYLEKRTTIFCIEYRLRHKDGTWRWIMDRGQGIWDERGRPVRMAGSHSDISDRKMLEEILSAQARTDALTGLPNRWEFDRLFENLLGTARREGSPLTVCVCDLDRFKTVNDTYGHAAGDQVLVVFGEILRQHLKKADLLARIGGDEFIIAMPGTTPATAGEAMERMRRQFGAHIFEARDVAFNVSSSFGVAPMRPSHNSGEDLIAEADRCLYGAKETGRDRTLVAA
jgi:diguanylate cyclase (GGDEF)-like protein/PAS domain S-box-containing protein